MEFAVTILPSGRRFVAEAGETLLTSAIRQGVGLPYSCRDGTCGTCKTKLVSGEVNLMPHSEAALSPAECAEGFTLPCCAMPESNVVLETDRVVAADMHPIKKMACRVLEIQKLAVDVAIVRLQLPGSDTLGYHPGQYLELALKDGTRRNYSMATAYGTRELELHVRHMPGGKFSGYVFDTLKVKDVLRLEGPFGSFFLRESAGKPLILLASGTGFAPIKAIIEQMKTKGIKTPATLYWGCRSKADLYLHEWAERAARELGNLAYVPVLSEPREADAWNGRTGLVHNAVMKDFPDLSGHQVYACGAPIMVDCARASFTGSCGLPADEFFADSFVTNHAHTAATQSPVPA
ncbi:MAG: ascD [Ramlibacter sp.]|jgi:CDP-4-dehydro-6-deoxyglucose reductase|nr:ascD [Ramlibacter sp.]